MAYPYFTSIFQEIYKRGGRKFGVLGLGPLGCILAMKAIRKPVTGECIEEASEQAKLHNKAVSKVLQKLDTKLTGFKYSMFDFYKTLRERMDNPSKYGTSDIYTIIIIISVLQAFLLCSTAPFSYSSFVLKLPTAPLFLLIFCVNASKVSKRER